MEQWQSFLKKAYLMGIGMATGAYDLFVINFVMLVLGDLYSLGSWESSLVATASLLGTFSGQVIFGLLGDKLGRKTSSALTCSFLLVGAFGSGIFTYDFAGISLVLFIMLSLWRYLLGIGIGGEYPVTAIFTGESDSSNDKRGTYIAGMFSAQGIGNVVAACFFLSLLVMFPPNLLDIVWRIALIAGGIPPLLILYPRLKMKESTAFQNQVKKVNISFTKTIKTCWKSLIGTAGCWFLFDIVFYGNSLFSGPILQAVGIADQTGWLGIVNNVAFNVVISFIALPGYWTATFFIDKIGRKPLQLIGFCMMALMYITIGIGYKWLTEYAWAFIILYGLSYFFANAGPNTTTFVIPTETYPAVIRSTCHGLSAASGKFGAIIGTFFINPLLNATSPQFIFILCGTISLVGAILTFFFIEESRGKDLDALDKEITPKITKDISEGFVVNV